MHINRIEGSLYFFPMIMKIIGPDQASKIGWAEKLGENLQMQYDYRKLVQKQHLCACSCAENASSLGRLVINIVVPLMVTAAYRL